MPRVPCQPREGELHLGFNPRNRAIAHADAPSAKYPNSVVLPIPGSPCTANAPPRSATRSSSPARICSSAGTHEAWRPGRCGAHLHLPRCFLVSTLPPRLRQKPHEHPGRRRCTLTHLLAALTAITEAKRPFAHDGRRHGRPHAAPALRSAPRARAVATPGSRAWSCAGVGGTHTQQARTAARARQLGRRGDPSRGRPVNAAISAACSSPRAGPGRRGDRTWPRAGRSAEQTAWSTGSLVQRDQLARIAISSSAKECAAMVWQRAPGDGQHPPRARQSLRTDTCWSANPASEQGSLSSVYGHT